MKYTCIGIGLFAVIIGSLFMCTLTVSESEYVVLTQFGKPSGTIERAGLYFKRPGFLETANRIDRRTFVNSTQPIQLLLGDKNPIVLTCYVCWRVHDPLLYFQSLTNTVIANQKLGDMVNSQLGSVLGDFELKNIINTDPHEVKISEIEHRILTNIDESTKEKYGIEIVKMGIQEIKYPSIVADAVYNRMKSEREKEAMKYRAEGREEATKIEAKTDREATEILAKAYKKSQILKGEGDRQALKIYSQSYGKDNEFFEFMKSMELYKEILKQKSTLILSADSELFKYLKDPHGNRKND